MIESKNKIEVDGYECNYNLQYPLLETEGKTYISVRDMADIFDKDVEWNENDQTIYLKAKEKKNILQIDDKIALKYAQAIVETRFPSKVSLNTQYLVCAEKIETRLVGYIVYVWFTGGAQDNIQTASGWIRFSSTNGECLDINF